MPARVLLLTLLLTTHWSHGQAIYSYCYSNEIARTAFWQMLIWFTPT